jgi:hypothetical protein
MHFLRAFPHHTTKELSSIIGVRSTSPISDKIWCQNCLAKLQVQRRCWAISCSWSQRGQHIGYYKPLLWSLSAGQHLFLIANQRKNLHFGGAQVFHNLFHGSMGTNPIKKAIIIRLGRELSEGSVHPNMSVRILWKCYPLRASHNFKYWCSPIGERGFTISLTHYQLSSTWAIVLVEMALQPTI